VRLNRADRAFWSIVALAVGVGAGAWAVLCCGLWALIHQAAAHGWSSLARVSLLPAYALVTFLGIALVTASTAATKQFAATRRLRRYVSTHLVVTPSELEDAAQRAGAPGRVDLVEVPQPFSFTYAAVRPRVVISTGLLGTTTIDELDAVIAHEVHHVRAADPLKLVVARTIRGSLFVLPSLDNLVDRYLIARELAADRRAVKRVGVPALAGALAKAVSGPSTLKVSAAAALSGDGLLEARVAQLETGRVPPTTPLDRRRLALSGISALALGGTMAAATMSLGPLVAQICHCG